MNEKIGKILKEEPLIHEKPSAERMSVEEIKVAEGGNVIERTQALVELIRSGTNKEPEI